MGHASIGVRVRGTGAAVALSILAVACGEPSPEATPVVPDYMPLPTVHFDPAWQLLSEGTMAAVYVEKALYERDDLPHFYVRLRVEPKGRGVRHVDLASEDSGFRPNQWGMHPEPRRGAINEMRLRQPAGILEGEARARALADFEHGGWIALGKAVDAAAVETFRPFNRSSPRDVKAREGAYFILSLDGNVRVSDGERFENLANVEEDYERYDLVLPTPVSWKPLPDDPDLLRPRVVPRPQGRSAPPGRRSAR